ncbi:ABC transporter substrate-binding protein [Undibacterium sp. Rencai35W]|uniref:ABC transporter substrate-binding protein n=1 Tax=Undibacterium sp. Rencai35W TaxID=3413046 RepID=UPI003BF225D8
MFSFFKKISVIIAVTTVMFSAQVFAGESAIVIGQAIDLSGPNGSIGRDYVAGITTYFDSLNVAGGINGRRIKYIARDDQGNPSASAKAVAELLDKDKVQYLLGGIGVDVTDAVVANPSFKDSGQILFAPLIGAVKNYGPRVLSWRPSPEQEMQYIFSYFDKLGIKNIGIAYQDAPLNQNMYQYVVEEVRKRNMKLSGVVKITGSSTDIEKDAIAMSKNSPHIVIAIADTLSTGLFLREFRKISPKTFVAGMSLTNLETLSELAGQKALEWSVFSQVVPSPTGNKSIIQIDHSKMMKKFRDEDLSALTLEGFIVAKTLAKAIQVSKTNRDGLQILSSQKGNIDLGGINITPSDASHHMSSFVDMALFKKGGGLTF